MQAGAALAAVLTLAGCGGGGGDSPPPAPPPPPPPPANFSVSGTVTGLTGAGLVLRNNGGDARTITANGSFTFATNLASGAAYVVTVGTRPSAPSQACVVANGAGTVGSANVTGIEVICGPAPGKFLYVTADSPVKLAGYAINAITGALSPITGSTAPSGSNPSGLATDPSGSFLYTGNNADVSAYSINAATGALTEVTGSPFAVGGNVSSMTFRPDGAFVYVPHYVNSLAAFAVNPATGALTPVPGSPYALTTQPAQPIIDPAGKFIYVPSGGSNELYGFSIHATTGALTPVPGSPYALGARSNHLEFGNGATVLYVSSPLNTFPDNSKVLAFTIAADGSLTAVSGSPFAAGVAGWVMRRSPDGRFLFVANAANSGAATITSFAINQVTGALTAAPGPSFQVGSGTVTFAVNPAGNRIVALTLAGTAPAFIAVDPTTGALTGTYLPAFGYAPLTGLLDRSGLFSYVLQYGGTHVYPYQVDLIGNRVGALPEVNVTTLPRQGLIVGSQ